MRENRRKSQENNKKHSCSYCMIENNFWLKKCEISKEEMQWNLDGHGEDTTDILLSDNRIPLNGIVTESHIENWLCFYCWTWEVCFLND